MTITIDYKDGEIQLSFPYNPRYIDIIKNTAENRRWSPEKRKWIVGLSDVQDLIIPKLLEEKIPHSLSVDYANAFVKDYAPIEEFGLKYPLYPYQIEGANSLYKHHRFANFSDTGLGKTIMMIAVLNKISSEEPLIVTPSGMTNGAEFLIVCPSSLKRQWQEEIEKFSGLSVIIIDGQKNKRARLWRTPSEIKIINYEKLRFDSEPFEKEWNTIVLDESTRIKNGFSKTSQRAQQLKSKRRYALTATPIENTALDVYNIFRFVDPMVLGKYKDFEDNFLILEYKSFGEHEFKTIVGHKNLDDLWKKINPFYFRRTKDEVLAELPNLIEENIYVELSPSEKRYYTYIKSLIEDKIDKIKEGETEDISIGGELQLLRVLCNGEICLKKSNTTNLNIISKQKEMSETSSKIEEVFMLIKNLKDKTIVFSDFVIPLGILGKRLEVEGIKYNMLIGESDKEKELDDFKNSDNKILLCQTSTGGYGLNLQHASNIVFMNRPWNPAKEYQAISRCHRMGQDKHVFVYYFITQDTIEEKIVETLKEKKEVSEKVIKENIKKYI